MSSIPVLTTLDYIPPFARQGCCFFCNTADNKKYLLTNVDLDFEGSVILCLSCAADFGQWAGMMPTKDHVKETESLRETIKNLTALVEDLAPKAERWNALVGELAARGTDSLPRQQEGAPTAAPSDAARNPQKGKGSKNSRPSASH